MEMQELSLEKFEEASEIVKKVTQETKLIYSEYFSERYGNKIYFKPENMQRTGAYKVRGAYYKISQLSPEERSRGLITASAGTICSEPATISARRRPLASGSPISVRTIFTPLTLPLPFTSIPSGWTLNLNSTPSSRAFFTSRREPGMFSSSRR